MPRPSTKHPYLIVVALLSALVIPACLTISTISQPPPALPDPTAASPLGYTWSLALFGVPIVVLGWWLATEPPDRRRRKAFWLTVLFWASVGSVMDLLFANSFFHFNNQRAVLGVYLPGMDFSSGWRINIPIEEFAFYFMGFLCTLLIYVWSDEHWLRAYKVEDHEEQSRQLPRIAVLHIPTLLLGLGVAGGAWLVKRYGPHAGQPGIPGYMWFLTAVICGPGSLFWRTSRRFTNWRAMSFTILCMLLISLLWEVTLGIPYQWWGYNSSQMMGVVITPWASLPVEALLVWLACPWMTVMIYEAARVWQARRQAPRQTIGSSPGPDPALLEM